MDNDAAIQINDLTQIILTTVLGIAFLVVYGGCVAWVIGDAQKRGRSGAAILLLIWLCAPGSALFWLFIRPRTTLAERPVQDYPNADDALAAASQLDMLGDWDEAIALYQSVAARWPEQENYINECIKSINKKKGVA